MAKADKFDPTRFDDLVAMQVEWSGVKGGGASFGTHKLVLVSPNRLEFAATAGARAFYLVFLVLGVGLFVGFTVSKLSVGDFSFNKDTLLSLIVGLVFMAGGGWAFYVGTTPIVFNKRNGHFWKGRKSPDEVFHPMALKHFAKFEDIPCTAACFGTLQQQ